jgi:hypothetical protein
LHLAAGVNVLGIPRLAMLPLSARELLLPFGVEVH